MQTDYIYAPGDRIFFGATSQFGSADQRVDNVGVLTEPVGVPDIGAVEAFSGPVNAVVTNTADSGPGSLRNILAAVPTGSTITFDPAVFAGAAAGANTIALTTSASLTALNIPANKAVTIDATAIPAGVKLDGGSQGFRLFTVNTGASLALHGLTLTRGGGASFTGNGGAILNSGTLTVTRSTLSGNCTDGTGGRGGALYNTATASITACTFSGNSADQSGGAIYTLAPVGTLTLTQCTVAGNTSAAGSGGGMRSGGGRLNLAHCTISGNTAPTTGNGGIFIGGDGSTITRVQNCIIARNTTRDVENLSDAYVPFTSLGHNIVGTGSAVAEFNAAGDIINNAPQLAALANNGGPTQTHALLANSPARNAAAELVPAITSDQRGFAIVGVPDIGAFEFPNTVPIAPNGAATATTGDSKTITLPATDADNHTLTIISTTPDSHLTVNSTSGLDVTFTPATNFVGDATLGYTVSDGNGGTASGTITVTITDNDAPTISGIFTPRIVSAGVMPDFRNQAVVSDNVSTPTVTQSALQGSVTTPGDVAMLLTATDAAGLTATINFTVSVRPLAAVHTIPFIIDGDNTPLAPGAGTNGLPADAKLTSFGPPATDEVGDVAFVAKWKSATSKGTGLFLNDQCLATSGGTAPVANAKWKTFTDPVVDGGTIVAIAGLTGTPKPPASVVVSGSAALTVVATAGAIAPDADGNIPDKGATFKTFKTVAIREGSIGIFAQLTGGTGANKASAANDLGIWIKDGSDPLKLVLRKGQNVGGKTIKSLVTFTPGKDSPGCGRGWLTKPGTGAALALVFFTDKTQAIVSADATGITAISKTGDATSNSLEPARFASFSFPATNDNDDVAFSGTMKVGTGDVTKADTHAVFVSDIDYGGYFPVAREGEQFGDLLFTVSKLGDPVLAANGATAFTVTFKSTALVKGAATKALWWKPVGEFRTLFQGGKRPGPDLPEEAQWKSFDSIAITDRGPIFAAKLVAGKGGVTAKTASGVWACDFTGAPRVLFRTGDLVNGKPLKSYKLLNATVGNLGVTRSFNNAAQVVWLATFTDKTSAIIVTEVP